VVEHVTFNHGVEGSSPSALTKLILFEAQQFFDAVRARIAARTDVGANKTGKVTGANRLECTSLEPNHVGRWSRYVLGPAIPGRADDQVAKSTDFLDGPVALFAGTVGAEAKTPRLWRRSYDRNCGGCFTTAPDPQSRDDV
jgi:hypothetical protein